MFVCLHPYEYNVLISLCVKNENCIDTVLNIQANGWLIFEVLTMCLVLEIHT